MAISSVCCGGGIFGDEGERQSAEKERCGLGDYGEGKVQKRNAVDLVMKTKDKVQKRNAVDFTPVLSGFLLRLQDAQLWKETCVPKWDRIIDRHFKS